MARERTNPRVSMLAFVDREERVPVDHPPRPIKRLAATALAKPAPVFEQMYAVLGRPSIPPERPVKVSLLISLFSIRSERACCENLDDHLLSRRFLDMRLMAPSFVPVRRTAVNPRTLATEVASTVASSSTGPGGE